MSHTCTSNQRYQTKSQSIIKRYKYRKREEIYNTNTTTKTRVENRRRISHINISQLTLMFGGGAGMGGGSGGSMLRVVGRTVARAGVTNLQEPISGANSSSSSATSNVTSPKHTRRLNSPNNNNNNNNNNLCLSSAGSAFGFSSVPISANSVGPISTCWPSFSSSCSDENDWVCVDGTDIEDGPIGFNDDFVLGPVPSIDEVHAAVSALTQVFDTAPYSELIKDKYSYQADNNVAKQISNPVLLNRVSSVGSELDWMEPSPVLCHPRTLSPYGSLRVHEAFRLLQTEPSVQRMVVSLSSDKAVWDAVLNNAVVQELRETYHADEKVIPPSSEASDDAGGESNPAMNFVKWIFDNTMGKVMELVDSISKLVNELFKQPVDGKAAGAADPFEDKLRTSFMLSVVVLLIVFVTRAQKA